MSFCVVVEAVEDVKGLFTFIASIFSNLSFIYMKLLVYFETVWGFKWLFTCIAFKLSLIEMGFCDKIFQKNYPSLCDQMIT